MYVGEGVVCQELGGVWLGVSNQGNPVVGTRFEGTVSFAHVRLLGERVFGLHFMDCLIRTRRPVVRFSITEYAGSCFGCGGWERECWFGRKHFGIN